MISGHGTIQTVKLVATDASGNADSCTFTVTLIDNTAPTAISQDTTVYLGAGGTVTIDSSFVNDGSTDNCGIETITLSQSIFDCTETGPNVITMTVTDVAGLSDVTNATVTVADSTPPVITCPINAIENVDGSCQFTLPDYTVGVATDNCAGVVVTQDPAAATTISGHGTIQTVKLVATDASGNADSCTFTVTLIDNTAPTAISQDTTVYIGAGGTVTIDSSFVNDGSTDNCGIETITLSQSIFDCTETGPNVITMTVTDVAGLSDVTNATVTVADSTPPVITCPINAIENVDGSCQFTLPDYTVGVATDNCAGVVVTQDPAAATTISGHGTIQTVKLVATDASGNADSCTFTVTLIDNTAPTAISQDTTVYLGAGGTVTIDSSFVNDGSTDNCGIETITLSQSIFDCSQTGPNVITMTVTDVAGLSDVTNATVTVADSTPPVITCPINAIENVDGSCQFTLPDYTVGVATDNCAGVVVTQDPAAATTISGHGTIQTVKLVATDASGNADSCTFTVTLIDNTAPTAISQDTTVYLGAGGTVTIDSSFVNDGSTDNCGIETITLSQSIFDCSQTGPNVITMTVTDVAGLSDVTNATVTVADSTPPVITCPINAIENVDGSCQFTLPDYTVGVATDNCAGVVVTQDPAAATTISGHGTIQTVKLVATDASGNADSCTFTVTLIDNTAPTAISQDTTVYLGAGGTVTIDSSFVNDGSTDNCGIETITLSQSIFDCSQTGPNVITMTVTDVAGLSDVTNATVTVADSTPPVITCPINAIENVDGSCQFTLPDYTVGVATDNCAGVVVTQDPAAATTISGHGTIQTVKLVATDASGNADSCTFTVTLIDNTAPTAISQDTTVYLGAGGTVTIDSSFVDDGSTDNCGVATITLSQSIFDCSQTGPNVITMTVTDVAGLSDVTNATVTVADSTPPVITCPINAIENVDGSCQFTLPDYTVGVATDNCAGVVVTQDPAAATTISGHGTIQTVKLVATDASGNADSCTFTVTLIDNTAPTAISQDTTVYLGAGGTVTIDSSFVNDGSTDNCGVATITLSQSIFDCSQTGPNVITMTVTDVAGLSDVTNATVTVADSTPPVITCPINAIENVDGSCQFTLPDYTVGVATDNCAGVVVTQDPAAATTISGHGTIQTVKLVATDASGNADSCTFTVTLIDNTAPTAISQDTTVYLGAGGTVTIDSSFVNDGSTDNCGIETITLSQSIFDCSQTGPNVITMTVTDVAGLSDVTNATVTVADSTPPVITCPINAIENVDGSCQFTLPDYTVGVATDNCAGVVVTQDPAAATTIIGHGTIQTVKLVATDASGNADSCTFTVTLIDNTAPTAISQDTTVYLGAGGTVTIDSSFVNDGSTDNCGIETITLSQSIFDCSQTGPNVITMTVTDVAGLSDVTNATVTVADSTPPVITCPINAIENVDGSCQFTLPDYTVGVATDNCAGVVVTQDPAAATTIIGHGTIQTVKLVATDASGNADSCTFTVTLIDNTAPTAISQDTTVYLGAGGTVTIDSSFVNDGSTDNCGIETITLSQSIFDCSQTGPNVITMTVTDVAGLSDVTNATVTVADSTPPVITCPINAIENVDGSCQFTLPDYTVGVATDNCAGVVVTQDPAAATTISGHGTIQTVKLVATDASGNADSCTFTVTLIDNTAPTAISQDTTVYLGAGGTVTIDSSFVNDGSTDNCGIETITLSQSIFDCSQTGPNVITMTVTDVAGLTAQSTPTVTVLDTIAPNALCQPYTVQLDAAGNAVIDSSQIDNGSTDNCGISTMSLDISSFTCAELGDNTVTMTVTDASGNSESCQATVTVEDVEDPVILCPNDTTVTAIAGSCSILVNDIAPGLATDNCSVNPVTFRLEGATTSAGSVDASGTIFNKGISTVWYKVSDQSGNADSCSFNVTVLTTVVPPDSAYAIRDSVCAGDGNITLSYTGGILGTSGVARWYDDAGLTSSIGEGNDLLIAAPLISTAYFVRIESDCDTTSEVSAQVYVYGSSAAPLSASSDRDTICGGDGFITLSYTGGGLGDLAIARWYSDTTFAFLVGEGNNLTIAAPVDSTTYSVRFEGPCDTTAGARTLVMVLPSTEPPTAVISDRNDLCPGDGVINLSYTGGLLGAGARAVWYTDTLAAPIGTGSSILVDTPDSTTTWYVRFEGGCDNAVAVPGTVTIKSNSIAPVTAISDVDSICAGAGVITLSYSGGSAGDGAVATWYADASLTESIAAGNDVSIASPDTTTTYYVRFEGDCDSTSAASVTVTVFSVSVPELTEMPENACINGPLYRYVVTGQAGSAYTWSITTNGTIASDRNDTVYVDWGAAEVSGRLEVIETTADGCESSAVGVDVNISGPSVDLGEDQNICEGRSATIVPTGKFTVVFWLNDGSTDPTYTTDTTEMVRIQVFDDGGCTVFDSVQITSYPSPEVDLGNDTTLCGEMSLILDAGNPDAMYLWSTGETTQTIEVFPGQQDISVLVTNPGGCSDSSSIRIRPCSPKEFFANIANTITPNGDGVNDTWQIDEVVAYPNMEIEIFDRWGKLVWRSTRGYAVQWDGRNTRGEEMPMNSYYFVINLNDGSDRINGTITIMR